MRACALAVGTGWHSRATRRRMRRTPSGIFLLAGGRPALTADHESDRLLADCRERSRPRRAEQFYRQQAAVPEVKTPGPRANQSPASAARAAQKEPKRLQGIESCACSKRTRSAPPRLQWTEDMRGFRAASRRRPSLAQGLVHIAEHIQQIVLNLEGHPIGSRNARGGCKRGSREGKRPLPSLRCEEDEGLPSAGMISSTCARFEASGPAAGEVDCLAYVHQRYHSLQPAGRPNRKRNRTARGSAG